MQSVIDNLNHWIIKVPEEFSRMSELEVSQRPMPYKWSKKEVLGHLCDIGNSQLMTLEWLIQDYFEHMEHHLKNQIFN